MTTSFVERERKFDVRSGFQIPESTGAVPPGSRSTGSVQHLSSEYFDTVDRALQRAGITFRRRTGTDDAGRHLTPPHGEHREELHAAVADVQPVELTSSLLGVTRGALLPRSRP